jgi:hypothetical protein
MFKFAQVICIGAEPVISFAEKWAGYSPCRNSSSTRAAGSSGGNQSDHNVLYVFDLA